MSPLTSSGGRRQFSLENANSVRTSIPSSAQWRTVALTGLIPARCPLIRGNARCRAQRPFPSMMMAMCRGLCSRFTGRADVAIIGELCEGFAQAAELKTP